MLTLSNTTCVLITGFCLIKSKAISFLKVALSRAYNTMLESTKNLAFIGFKSVKFKIAHIKTMLFPKFKGFFSFSIVSSFFFNRKSNNFYLLTNEFFWKLNSLPFIGGYDYFSVHKCKAKCFQKYELTH